VRIFAEQLRRPLMDVNLERFSQLSATLDSRDPTLILNQIEATDQFTICGTSTPGVVSVCRASPV
jgi:hypothetical protein